MAILNQPEVLADFERDGQTRDKELKSADTDFANFLC